MSIIIKKIPDCLTSQGCGEQTIHSHDYYQLMWFWHGTGCHHIDFKDEQLTPDKIFVVSPGQLHNFKPCLKCEGIIIQFDESFFSTEANNLEIIIKYSVFNAFHRPPYYLINKSTGERLRGIAEEILREQDDNGKFLHDHYIHDLVNMFLIILIREGMRDDHQHIYNNSAAFMYFIKFRKELDTSYQKYHTTQQYARALGISVKTLTNSTIQCCGQTPLKLINNRLTVEAKRMLISTPKLIKEIAYNLGFEDDSYFVKFFKRQVGLLPTEYRDKETRDKKHIKFFLS